MGHPGPDQHLKLKSVASLIKTRALDCSYRWPNDQAQTASFELEEIHKSIILDTLFLFFAYAHNYQPKYDQADMNLVMDFIDCYERFMDQYTLSMHSSQQQLTYEIVRELIEACDDCARTFSRPISRMTVSQYIQFIEVYNDLSPLDYWFRKFRNSISPAFGHFRRRQGTPFHTPRTPSTVISLPVSLQTDASPFSNPLPQSPRYYPYVSAPPWPLGSGVSPSRNPLPRTTRYASTLAPGHPSHPSPSHGRPHTLHGQGQARPEQQTEAQPSSQHEERHSPPQHQNNSGHIPDFLIPPTEEFLNQRDRYLHSGLLAAEWTIRDLQRLVVPLMNASRNLLFHTPYVNPPQEREAASALVQVQFQNLLDAFPSSIQSLLDFVYEHIEVMALHAFRVREAVGVPPSRPFTAIPPVVNVAGGTTSAPAPAAEENDMSATCAASPVPSPQTSPGPSRRRRRPPPVIPNSTPPSHPEPSSTFPSLPNPPPPPAVPNATPPSHPEPSNTQPSPRNQNIDNSTPTAVLTTDWGDVASSRLNHEPERGIHLFRPARDTNSEWEYHARRAGWTPPSSTLEIDVSQPATTPQASRPSQRAQEQVPPNYWTQPVHSDANILSIRVGPSPPPSVTPPARNSLSSNGVEGRSGTSPDRHWRGPSPPPGGSREGGRGPSPPPGGSHEGQRGPNPPPRASGTGSENRNGPSPPPDAGAGGSGGRSDGSDSRGEPPDFDSVLRPKFRDLHPPVCEIRPSYAHSLPPLAHPDPSQTPFPGEIHPTLRPSPYHFRFAGIRWDVIQKAEEATFRTQWGIITAPVLDQEAVKPKDDCILNVFPESETKKHKIWIEAHPLASPALKWWMDFAWGPIVIQQKAKITLRDVFSAIHDFFDKPLTLVEYRQAINQKTGTSFSNLDRMNVARMQRAQSRGLQAVAMAHDITWHATFKRCDILGSAVAFHGVEVELRADATWVLLLCLGNKPPRFYC